MNEENQPAIQGEIVNEDGNLHHELIRLDDPLTRTLVVRCNCGTLVGTLTYEQLVRFEEEDYTEWYLRAAEAYTYHVQNPGKELTQ